MSDEKMNSDSQPSEELQEGDTAAKAISRRQFLIGAGAGIVAGVAGTAVAVSTTAPAQPAPAGAPAAGAQPAAPAAGGAVASALPATHRQVKLNIDNKDYDLVVDVRTSLWEAMTYELGMSSSNVGCDRAQCGACAVVIDGRAVNGCTILAARLGRGQKILTVDGISKGQTLEQLHPIAKAYHLEGGLQCGLCTRGFIMSTYALLSRNKAPNEDDIREALGGNICRCSEYPKIYESVYRAAEEMRKA
ncbi:MAG: (2Fe-2S)-binding protein [Chloroflexi bacterium]|nr:(2Fe-2S)-binding protein [Chloroflexota bacterium]